MKANSVTVVKIGGSLLDHHDKALAEIATLNNEGYRFVIVHGGSKMITRWLNKFEIESTFYRGLRVTTEPMIEIVVAVLSLINKRLVAELQSHGASAVGLSGLDGAILRAKILDPKLGQVGRIVSVNTRALKTVLKADAIAVLTPFAQQAKHSGKGLHPRFLNVNADTAAGAVAAELRAERLVVLTDVAGVRNGAGVLSELRAAEAKQMIANGSIKDGMIPKIEATLRATDVGVPATIVDGRRPGNIRRLVEGKPVGTSILP